MNIGPVGLFPIGVGGMNRAASDLAKAAGKIVSEPLEAAPIVQMSMAKTSFSASAAVFRAADEIAREVIDILA